jgi:collagen type III alpha
LWPSQQSQQPPPQPPPQQQPSRQASMPPGLSSVARGLIGGPYGQPPQLPNQQGMPLQQQQPRHLPQTRKYTGDSSMAPTGIPNFPPGMGPPPGFMTAGPPPGFPGVATAAANHPSRFPAEASQGVRSGFMEMYGDMGGRGLGLRGGPAGNGGGPMPGYR